MQLFLSFQSKLWQETKLQTVPGQSGSNTAVFFGLFLNLDIVSCFSIPTEVLNKFAGCFVCTERLLTSVIAVRMDVVLAKIHTRRMEIANGFIVQ